jgi:hypothetical protein
MSHMFKCNIGFFELRGHSPEASKSEKAHRGWSHCALSTREVRVAYC